MFVEYFVEWLIPSLPQLTELPQSGLRQAESVRVAEPWWIANAIDRTYAIKAGSPFEASKRLSRV